MESGKVVFVSPNQGMIVVQHDDGFAVVELLGSEGEFGLGDIVKGRWDELGGEPIQKAGVEHDAYYQGNWSVGEQAVAVARRTGGG